VEGGGQTLGTFVVARFYEPELTEIDAAVRVMAVTSAVVLVVSSVVGWLTVGGVVAPIRRITRTARRISDTDLSERIPVSGHDEVAELTSTFNGMLDRLETAFGDQRRFLDDIGHELRTPLTIVRGQLELLPEDSDERRQTLDLCLEEIDRMNRYVTELILLAKSEKPDFLRLAPVDLTELTENMQTRAVALAPDRTWQVDASAPAVIEADPDRLNQAWLNLVNNAVQHTGPGGLVAIGSSVVNGEVRLWVRDNGPGVPLDEQEHIFERFGRGADTRIRRSEGTGLGLSIVSAIGRAHGGRVELESRAGQGARFTLVIPEHPDAETRQREGAP
jgi:signal transduction histidine kinase